MSELQKQLIDKNKKIIEETQKIIKETELEIARLEAELKVEKKLFEEKLINESDCDEKMKEIKKQVKGNIGALETMLGIEQNKLQELKTDFEISRLRKTILNNWF